jgi:hypothetical protein
MISRLAGQSAGECGVLVTSVEHGQLPYAGDGSAEPTALYDYGISGVRCFLRKWEQVQIVFTLRPANQVGCDNPMVLKPLKTKEQTKVSDMAAELRSVVREFSICTP